MYRHYARPSGSGTLCGEGGWAVSLKDLRAVTCPRCQKIIKSHHKTGEK